MVPVQEFVRLLAIEHNLIKVQTEGLSQEDTLLQPRPGGNCMNWVLGHILQSQIEMLDAMGDESPATAWDLSVYRRETAPILREGAGVLPLDSLLDGLTQVHLALMAALDKMDDVDFKREMTSNGRKTTLGWRVLFLNFHYTYHIGQLEQLRQLAGRTEKVL